MFGTPYFNNQQNIEKINSQIADLERAKLQMQSVPQQPINIYNNSNAQNNDFKAQYVKENEDVRNLIVQSKTAFIDVKKGLLAVKETNGDITEYQIIIPKTPEQLKIEELERRLSAYEQQYNANTENGKPRTVSNVYDDTTTKGNSRTIQKKPE